jgi:hypothetical protein
VSVPFDDTFRDHHLMMHFVTVPVCVMAVIIYKTDLQRTSTDLSQQHARITPAMLYVFPQIICIANCHNISYLNKGTVAGDGLGLSWPGHLDSQK